MLTCDPTTRADSSDSRAFKYSRQESFTETHKYFLMFRIFINPKPEKSLLLGRELYQIIMAGCH